MKAMDQQPAGPVDYVSLMLCSASLVGSIFADIATAGIYNLLLWGMTITGLAYNLTRLWDWFRKTFLNKEKDPDK
jgi:hypothetical protein